MFNVLLTLLITASGGIFYGESSEDWIYSCVAKRARYDCKNRKWEDIDPEIIDTLIKVEKQYNVPNELKGMLLAAACVESGFNPKAKGDRKFSKDKKTPKAIGILQMWPVYEKMYPGLDRTNPEQAAHGWMKHIVSKLPKVDKQCRYKTDYRRWVAAWVTGIRYKKPGGRCLEKPKHLKVLRRWHRHIANNGCEEGC